jgi:hypothetical protein
MAEFIDNTKNTDVPTITALILGNGFDIANNFPTRYSDFIKSSYFQELLNSNNQLASHIKSVYNLYNWVDVEVELGNYSFDLERKTPPSKQQEVTEQFREEYMALTKALYSYINSIRSGRITNPKMADLIEDWKESAVPQYYNNKLFVVNFNYLLHDKILFQHSMNPTWFVNENPLHIHGITDYQNDQDAKIVLGVEDDGHRGKSHNFIVKAFNGNAQAEVFFRNVDKVDKFIIFGCSIGETDKRYFKQIFDKKGKFYEIYGYGQNGLCNLKSNISKICNYDNFLRDNEVKFIDSKQFDYK